MARTVVLSHKQDRERRENDVHEQPSARDLYLDACADLDRIGEQELSKVWTEILLAATCETSPARRRSYTVAARALATATLSERYRLAMLEEVRAEMDDCGVPEMFEDWNPERGA